MSFSINRVDYTHPLATPQIQRIHTNVPLVFYNISCNMSVWQFVCPHLAETPSQTHLTHLSSPQCGFICNVLNRPHGDLLMRHDLNEINYKKHVKRVNCHSQNSVDKWNSEQVKWFGIQFICWHIKRFISLYFNQGNILISCNMYLLEKDNVRN